MDDLGEQHSGSHDLTYRAMSVALHILRSDREAVDLLLDTPDIKMLALALAEGWVIQALSCQLAQGKTQEQSVADLIDGFQRLIPTVAATPDKENE